MSTYSHTIDYQFTDGSATPITKRVTISAEGRFGGQTTVNGSTNDKELLIAIDVSALKSLIMYSDQNLTVETNSGSAADDTIALIANEPLIWNDKSLTECPLSTDVTALYLTRGAGTAANFVIETLQDNTP